MPVRCTEDQDLVGEKDEHGKALFANLERGMGFFSKFPFVSFLSVRYKLDNLYCKKKKYREKKVDNREVEINIKY